MILLFEAWVEMSWFSGNALNYFLFEENEASCDFFFDLYAFLMFGKITCDS